jgi:hypothetical protein
MRQLGRRTGLAMLKDAQVFGYRRFDLDQRYLAQLGGSGRRGA